MARRLKYTEFKKTNTRVHYTKDIFGKVYVDGAYKTLRKKKGLSASLHRKIEGLPKSRTKKAMEQKVRRFINKRKRKLIY